MIYLFRHFALIDVAEMENKEPTPESFRSAVAAKIFKNKVIHISQYLILLNKETVEDHFTLNLKLKQGAVESCHVVEKMVFLKYLDKFSLKLEKFSNISR